MRGKYLAAVLAALLLGIGAGPAARGAAAAPPQPTKPRDYKQYATSAYDAMQKYLYTDTANRLYEETYPAVSSPNPYAYHWPFSRAMAGTVDLWGLAAVGQAAVQDRQAGAGRYWNQTAEPLAYDSYVRPPLGNGGDQFYDDNAWSGLNLVRIHRMGGDPDGAALARARQLFDFAVSGWDTDETHPAPGGVFWVAADWNRDRNTVSSAPNAILGLRLYQLTGEPYYYEWALRMYDWTNAYMLAPNGLYWDHIDLNGVIDTTQWSYNQGTMVGASVLLYRITGDGTYLARAESIAKAALDHYGSVGYFGQDPAFNAIYFRNLLLLHGATADAALQGAIRTAMAGYANQVWDDGKIHKRTHLFYFGGGHAKLVDQGAMVEVYACLAWDPAGYDLLV